MDRILNDNYEDKYTRQIIGYYGSERGDDALYKDRANTAVFTGAEMFDAFFKGLLISSSEDGIISYYKPVSINKRDGLVTMTCLSVEEISGEPTVTNLILHGTDPEV